MVNHCVRAVAPSNIAFIKYWGKSDASVNWPANDSLSMTLNRARSITTASVRDARDGTNANRIRFLADDGSGRTIDVPPKMAGFLDWLRTQLAPFAGAKGSLDITTQNTFPSACGIASSASGFAALTLAATGAWTGTGSIEDLEKLGITRAMLAAWARRGSGSACRSIEGGYVHWQRNACPGTQTVNQIHSGDYWQLANLIVLIDQGKKQVSSSEGHARAFTSPRMRPRLDNLQTRLREVIGAIAAQDLERLGSAIETEAVEMHDIMLTSTPRTQYFGEATTRFLDWTRKQRASGNLDAWFTLDAGPNPHLICRPEDSVRIAGRIKSAFPGLSVIADHTGHGAMLEEVPGGH